MKKLILLFMFMLSIGTVSHAQYSSAIGLRLGYPVSVSYKQFLNDSKAIEAFAGIYYSDITFGLNYMIHKDISSVDNLRWFYGFGGVGGLYDGAKSGIALGISGNIGLDYAFDDIPLNISIDAVPTFFIIGSGYNSGYLSGFDGFGAISARYILGSN